MATSQTNVSYKTSEDEQNKLLERARQIVKDESLKMKTFLDKGERANGMKHALVMLCELHTSLLSPKKYFELFIETTDHLRHLHNYIINEMEAGKKVSDLYEYVQYTGNIVPRLYLLITVGTVYIRTREAASKRILHDLVEMCRGVQHPLRGLFLRNYLLQMTKDHLPDGKNSNPEYGTVVNSIDFVLMNFAEMNKLWVRMQHQGHTRDRLKREQERRELCILVGTNLERISQLNDITVDLYKEKVLPVILRQAVLCKDRIAQEYLMECIIQVFPDEFHLATLDAFLDACKKLHETVNVQRVVGTLMDRLAKFKAREASNEDHVAAGVPGEDKATLFDIFSKQVKELQQARPKMPLADVLSLYVSCTELALQFYPDRLDYADDNFEQVLGILEKNGIESDICSADAKAAKQITYLLNVPVGAFANPMRVLELENFTKIMSKLGFFQRKDTAVTFVETVLQRNQRLTTAKAVDRYLGVIAPLVVDQVDNPTRPEEDDEEDFMDDQCMVAKSITLVEADDLNDQLGLLVAAKKHFFEGGERRFKVTLPALIFKALRLASDYAQTETEEDDEPAWESKAQAALKLVQQAIQKLKEDYGEMAMMLSLQAALVADECEFDTIAYEFFSQAFELFEEDAGLTSNDQAQAFPTLVGTLQQTSCFSEENFVLLATKCAQIPATKILRKQDQCRALCTASYIFWTGQYRKVDDEDGEDKDNDDDDNEVVEVKNGQRVMECIKKALKLATNASDHRVPLFGEVLNHCVGFFVDGCENVTADFINRLVGLISKGLAELDDSPETQRTKAYFESTKNYMRKIKDAGGAGGTWADIDL